MGERTGLREAQGDGSAERGEAAGCAGNKRAADSALRSEEVLSPRGFTGGYGNEAQPRRASLTEIIAAEGGQAKFAAGAGAGLCTTQPSNGDTRELSTLLPLLLSVVYLHHKKGPLFLKVL